MSAIFWYKSGKLWVCAVSLAFK
ncbi:MAG: KxYKxGKxW signal peptide domain-containing protein [Microcystaceae cyanobacterium]